MVKASEGLPPDELQKRSRMIAWRRGIALGMREKYYGVFLEFDPRLRRFYAELIQPFSEEKLRDACKALKEAVSSAQAL